MRATLRPSRTRKRPRSRTSASPLRHIERPPVDRPRGHRGPGTPRHAGDLPAPRPQASVQALRNLLGAGLDVVRVAESDERQEIDWATRSPLPRGTDLGHERAALRGRNRSDREPKAFRLAMMAPPQEEEKGDVSAPTLMPPDPCERCAGDGVSSLTESRSDLLGCPAAPRGEMSPQVHRGRRDAIDIVGVVDGLGRVWGAPPPEVQATVFANMTALFSRTAAAA